MSLPVELLYEVVSYLPPYGVVCVASACVALRELLADDLLWSRVYAATFGTRVPRSRVDEVAAVLEDGGAVGGVGGAPADALSWVPCPTRVVTLKRAARDDPFWVRRWKAWGAVSAARARRAAALARGDALGCARASVACVLAAYSGGEVKLAAHAAATALADVAAEPLAAEPLAQSELPHGLWAAVKLPLRAREGAESMAATSVVTVDEQSEPRVSLEVTASWMAGLLVRPRSEGAVHLRDAALMWAEAAVELNESGGGGGGRGGRGGGRGGGGGGEGALWALRRAMTFLEVAGHLALQHGAGAITVELTSRVVELMTVYPAVFGSPSESNVHFYAALAHVAVGDWDEGYRSFVAYAGTSHVNRIRYSAARYWMLASLCKAVASGVDAGREALALFAAQDDRLFDHFEFGFANEVLGAVTADDPLALRTTVEARLFRPDDPVCLVLRGVIDTFFRGAGLGDLCSGHSDDSSDFDDDDVEGSSSDGSSSNNDGSMLLA